MKVLTQHQVESVSGGLDKGLLQSEALALADVAALAAVTGAEPVALAAGLGAAVAATMAYFA